MIRYFLRITLPDSQPGEIDYETEFMYDLTLKDIEQRFFWPVLPGTCFTKLKMSNDEYVYLPRTLFEKSVVTLIIEDGNTNAE